MTTNDDTTPVRDDDRGTVHVPTSRQVVVEREVLVPSASEHDAPRRRALVPFIAGFFTAVVLGALGLVVFLAVSDSDDDGRIELDVPAVEVQD
jgi:hypothetical protein